METELEFLVKHLKYHTSSTNETISKERFKTEDDSDEYSNLTLGDVLRCKVQEKEKTNVVSNVLQSTNTNSFASALKKLRCTSTINSYLQKESTEARPMQTNESVRSTALSTMTSDRKEADKIKHIVPQLDKFAAAKRAKTAVLEDKVETLVDKSMQFLNDTSTFHQAANNDNEYEQSIREMLRSVPYDKIPDFVTHIHILISSFKTVE